ncbi:hypothetical protein PHLGIDRAFT_534790 [Phlebiopsis gigantea 11061_1 CR5-6]|uniref:Uncharacterized protein n=1 Tax=Phlebiopsis gigantea (strain 11061_1 CR5-6) TaxID=745531 RepID=A0A0C3PL62_PHLG1|nr:hypothetical protein PHLGIDRAFT_534790 [Phlebiopsis gigantea 11061_1 CR5-6]
MDFYTTITVAAPVPAEHPDLPINKDSGGGGGITSSCVVA